MDILHALILSIIEGITEFLPISSTGHLVLTSTLLHIQQTEFVKSFEIFIQLGAILAVVVLYFKKVTTDFEAWKRILVAFLPTAIIGLTLYKMVKQFLIGNDSLTVAALFLGGIALILLELIHKEQPHHKERIEDMDYKQAFFIGLVQSLSIIPGVSRAAATIMGGLFLGLKRKTATEFSFLLAIPTMAAATLLDLTKSNFAFSSQEYLVLFVGFIGSFLTAIVAIKFLLQYIQKNTFIPFGIYRIAIALLFFFFVV